MASVACIQGLKRLGMNSMSCVLSCAAMTCSLISLAAWHASVVARCGFQVIEFYVGSAILSPLALWGGHKLAEEWSDLQGGIVWNGLVRLVWVIALGTTVAAITEPSALTWLAHFLEEGGSI